METADVATLTQRIQELEKENARLRAILEKNGIGYDKIETTKVKTGNNEVASVSAHQYSLQEKYAKFLRFRIYKESKLLLFYRVECRIQIINQ